MQTIQTQLRKLLTELTPSNSYQPAKYYECSYLLNVQSDLLINFSHPEILIVCDHCQSIMSFDDISVLVEQIHDNGPQYSDLCVRCLSKLISGKSVPKGQYFVRTANVFSIKTANWRVADQILLLKGIEKYGYGNWTNVQIWMQSHGSFLNHKGFQKHFIKHIWDKKHPLFEEEIHFRQSTKQRRQIFTRPYYLQNVTAKRIRKHKFTVEKNQVQQDIQKSDDTMSSHHRNDESDRQDNIKSQKQSQLSIYIPQRNEFLVQYECLAQSLIADIEFSPNDTQMQIELKQQLLIKYNEKLKERMIKKKFVIEEDLLHHVEGSPEKIQVDKIHSKDVKNQKKIKEIKPNFSSGFLDGSNLTESQKLFENFIESSKRYFIDDQEMNETKSLALSYINSRTLLHTLKAFTDTTDKKKKCKKISDVMQKIQKRNKNEQQ